MQQKLHFASEIFFSHLVDLSKLPSAELKATTVAQTITELKDIWPELKLVHGEPWHQQSQGSVERVNERHVDS